MDEAYHCMIYLSIHDKIIYDTYTHIKIGSWTQ